MIDFTGQELDNYHLLRLLGSGGFGAVYLGEHVHSKQRVAVKVLGNLFQQADLINVQNEVRNQIRLQHPHIVKIIDFNLLNSPPFIVMEYAWNGTLRQRHPRGTRVTLPTVVNYVKQIASALQYAHDQQPALIHRDVKPENMLLNGRDEIMLADFGLATLITHRPQSMRTQDIAGTEYYMSPEQSRGRPQINSDQYSLAVVVYEWLCGTIPFQADDPEDPFGVVIKHRLAPPPSMRKTAPTIPIEVEQVILTALNKEPEKRFRSISAFAATLEQASQPKPSFPSNPPLQSSTISIKNSLPPTAPPPTRTHSMFPTSLNADRAPHPQVTNFSLPPPARSVPSQSFVTREAPSTPLSLDTSTNNIQSPKIALVTNPVQANNDALPERGRGISRRTALIGLTTLVLIGGGTWTALSRWLFIPEGTTLYTYQGHSSTVNTVTWSPDGKRIASGSDDHTVQVWNAADGSSPFTYKGHSKSVSAVTWSPDGKHIASASWDNTVQIWNAADGSSPFTYKGHSSTVYTVAWSPDGKRIASGSDDKTVQIWDAADGSSLFTHVGHSSIVNTVAWSPDGKRIASGSVDNTARVWNAADDSSPFTYKGHFGTVFAVAWSPNGKRIASGSADATVQVWNAADGSSPFTYKGHSNPVVAVAWSSDGTHIISGSWDGTVKIWNATDGSSPFTYIGHSDMVNAIAWSPDGKHIASGSADNTVQIWQGP